MRTLYFPFRSQLAALAAQLNTSKSTYLIHGGRGVGKTTFLRHLEKKKELQRLDKNNIYFIDGNDENASRQALESKPSRPVLFDNIDRFLDKDADREKNAHPTNQNALERFLATRENIFVATTTAAQVDLLTRARSDSLTNWVINSVWTLLTPCTPGWQDIVLTTIYDYGIKDEKAQVWLEAIVNVTGGHPSLVGAALSEFEAAQQTLADGSVQHSADREARYTHSAPVADEVRNANPLSELTTLEAMESFLSIALISGGALMRVKRAIEGLKGDVQSVLFTSARDGSLDKVVDLVKRDVKGSGSLLASGLTYIDPKTKQLALVGGLVKAHLSSLAPVTYTLNWEEADDMGTINLLADGRPLKSVKLGGDAWKVLKEILREDGRIASFEDLSRAVGSKETSASDPEKEEKKRKDTINSALQRARAALKEIGVEGFIESVREEGYRKFPGWRHYEKSA